MRILYKLLRQDPENREGVIVATSALNIIVNLLIAGTKIFIGIISSSMAILSEGANNATDAATSVLALLGAKFSGMRPTKKHPFGFGRIEYFASLIIGVLIFTTGTEFLLGSVQRIFHPEPLEVSYITLSIVAVTAVVRLLLGSYTVRAGKRAQSGSLIAVGTECRNDAVISSITIISSLVFLIFNLSLDAYAGMIISAIIIKTGVQTLLSTVSSLLGENGRLELAETLYREIRQNEIVLNAADMMLHNYGPDAFSGSVNIEIDHKKTVEEVYASIHEMQLRLMHQYHVTMVFGIYAVNHDDDAARRMRREIAGFVRGYEHVLSYHALYVDQAHKRIYCDLVVDYALKDWDALREAFTQFIKQQYPDFDLELVVETEFV